MGFDPDVQGNSEEWGLIAILHPQTSVSFVEKYSKGPCLIVLFLGLYVLSTELLTTLGVSNVVSKLAAIEPQFASQHSYACKVEEVS